MQCVRNGTHASPYVNDLENCLAVKHEACVVAPVCIQWLRPEKLLTTAARFIIISRTCQENENEQTRPPTFDHCFCQKVFFKGPFASDVYPDNQHFVSNALRLIRHRFLKCARKDNVSKQTQPFEQMCSFLSLALMRVLCSRRANFVSRSASAWFLFYRNEGFHECRYMEMCVCR